MLVCNQCNNEQETGKFCGACGGSLQLDGGETAAPSANQAAATTTAQPQTQQTTETIKNGLSEYWNYFLNLIKNPTRAFQLNESHFINGLINIGLFAVAFSLSVYFFMNSLLGFLGESLPFFQVNLSLLFGVLLFIIISAGSALAMTKAGKNQDSFKTFIAQYGGLFAPFTALNVIAVLGGLMGVIALTLIPLTVSLSIAFFFVPVLFVFEKLSALNNSGQKVYLSLATLILISFGTYIIGEMMVFEFIDELQNSFLFF